MQKQTEINQNADKIAGQKVFADDGFYFGIGAFETIAVEDGVPQLLAWHLERLRKSLAFFKIAQTVEEQEVNTWLKEYEIRIRRNNIRRDLDLIFPASGEMRLHR